MLKSRFVLPVAVLLVAACGGAAPPTQAPTNTPVPTSSPAPTQSASPAPTDTTAASASVGPSASAGPSTSAGASLDPSQSDAGIVGTVTITNDTRGHRDGTHTIAGVEADSSDCSYSFEGDTYNAVAWYDAAPDGQLFRFGVTISADQVPDADGQQTLEDGRVSFEFVSASGFGTQYSGDASSDSDGKSTVNVTRAGNSLTFEFTGTTWDNVNFAGSLTCADAGLTTH